MLPEAWEYEEGEEEGLKAEDPSLEGEKMKR